uniref:Caveolin n=1 Tax=Myripristis murdjan TaxID=586833 RepID=A0A667XEW2_9TELE
MVSDDCLVECKIDDDDDEDSAGAGEEQLNTPPPPPEFASKNRDPYGINQHLKVEVSDVLAEPDTPRSIDQVWFYSVVGFESARIWTYRCLSLLLAVPFALLSGVFLAILACLHVWCVVPCIQLSNTFLPCLRSLWMCVLNIFITPFCSSLAHFCSQIAISVSNKDWSLRAEKDIV